MDFWRAVEILSKRKWLILLSVVVTTALTWGATRLMGARWMATVKFICPPASVLAGSPGPEGEQDSRGQQAVYASLVTSRDVLEPVLRKLHQTRLPSDLLNRIEFEAKGSRLFELHVTDSSPARAELLANALAERFVEKNHSLYTKRAEKAANLLQEQLRQVDARLAEARRRYDTYSARHAVLGGPQESLKSALSRFDGARQRRDVVAEKLSTAQALLQSKERQMAQVSSAPSPVIGTEPNLRVKQLQADLDQAERQLTDLRERYFDQHPRVKQAVVTHNALEARLKAARAEQAAQATQQAKAVTAASFQQGIRDLKQEIAGDQAQIATLDATMATAEGQIKTSELNSPLGSLAGEITERAEARAGLITRLNNARMALDVAERQNPIAIMEAVNTYNPPMNTTSGRTRKLIVLAFFCALVSTCALIIAFDSVDRRLRTVQEAELALPARVIAAIPAPMGAVTYATLARAAELHPQSLQSESYRFLGMHLLNPRGPRARSLMVLSAKAEQGSTTTVTNLGITLAQAGQRVIIVDANLRTPELHQVFNMPNDFGFTNLLQDPTADSLEQALRPTSVANLRVITTGPSAANPWKLFRSQNLRELAHRLHASADFVLYDTPSAVMFTDALNLAPIVDAAILCVRAQERPSGAEQRLIELIEQANVTVLGCVLNDVPPAVVEGYHNYQHYYAPAISPGSGQAPAPDVKRGITTQALETIELPVYDSVRNGGNGNGAS